MASSYVLSYNNNKISVCQHLLKHSVLLLSLLGCNRTVQPQSNPQQPPIMDKSLGTNLHLRCFFTHTKQTVTREFIYTCSAPSPTPPPLQCWTCVDAISPELPHCIGRGEGGSNTSERDNSAFSKLYFKNTEKYM